jgi:CheY-like chemotaxis protein
MAARQSIAGRDRGQLAPHVARVLLVEDDVAARLTLQAILQASGYAVDLAGSAPEAMEKIEGDQYALVLCGLHSDDGTECRRVLHHARAQDYRPATAFLTASGVQSKPPRSGRLLIETEEVPALLAKIAELLAGRAAGRERRNMRRRLALVAN